jgi:hypothetical protein
LVLPEKRAVALKALKSYSKKTTQELNPEMKFSK